jgi:excisionase family DNA binding protein
LKATDVAKILKCSSANIYNLVKAGFIQAVVFKAGGNRSTYRFRQEDVDAFIKGHLYGGRQGAAAFVRGLISFPV